MSKQNFLWFRYIIYSGNFISINFDIVTLLNVKRTFHQLVVIPSYLYNGNLYSSMTISLYWMKSLCNCPDYLH